MSNKALTRLLHLPHWVFDLDGVIVDSSEVHASAFRRTFAEIGVEFNNYPAYAGQSTWNAIESHLLATRGEAPSDLVRELVRKKQHLAMENLSEGKGIVGLPGVLEVLALGQRLEKTISLVTSASAERVDIILEAKKLGGYFQNKVTAADVERGKPDPEPYLTLLKQTGCDDSSRFLVFEDSENGVISARRAGMQVIHVNHGGSKHPESQAEIKSFQEILEATGRKPL